MHSDPDQYKQVIDQLTALCEKTADESDRQALREAAAALSGVQHENKEAGKQAEAILSAVDRWVIAYDAGGTVIRAGPAMDETAGTSLVGMEMRDVIRHLSIRHPDGRPVRQDEMPAYRALRGESVAGERLDITDREGRTVHALVSAAPVTAGGVPSGAVAVWQDVTEQEETNTLLEGMFESLGDIVGVQLPDHTILRYNKAGYELLGMTPEEVKGRKCYELIGRDQPCEVCATRAAVRSKKQERLEKYVPEMGRYLECWSTPVLDEKGEILLIVEHLHDVTDRVLAMEALRESEATARALLNAPTDAISLVGADGRVIDVNETMILRYGKGREAVIGRHVSEIFPPEIARRRIKRLNEVLESGAPVRFEEQGTTGWFDTVIYPIRDETGRIARAAVIARDITDRKRMEERLVESEERFRALLDATSDLASLIDGEGTLLALNDVLALRLGGSVDELIGKNVYKFFTPEAAILRKAKADEVISSGKPVHFVDEAAERVFESTVYPVLDARGKVGRVAVIARDITEQRQLERLRQEAFSQIEQNMEQFAILGDHVRHPLQVILARADLLEDEETAAKIQEQVRRINGYIRNLDRGWVESRKIREYLRRNDLL
jgi:PAS domain S-box-containing protein